ncbi:MAG: zinc-dependent metalloprotease, partial [Mucinivorans sp.]
ESMIRFVKSPDGDNLFVQEILTGEMPRDTVGDMNRAVLRSNVQPLVMSLKIEATNKTKDSVLVNMTDYINGDSELIGFMQEIKEGLGLVGFMKDRSYITSVKSYPINIELKSVKTYMRSPKSSSGRPMSPSPVTFEINCSMVLLPEKPMQPRWDDRRVGYFTENYTDYSLNPQGVKDVSMISRFRLEPKPEDMERYKAGELVEPIKPIIFYIDPATPEKWIPYLMQGVNDWQEAFEQAGFKNAIMALRAPTAEQDSTWSIDDARFSAIVYKASDIPNANGPHVSDPRSGETIESHINWYHNVQTILHNWYMLQVGPNDPRARAMEFPDDLMGQLIRFVSSHEVGHTLGLRHNMGATSTVPVDSLRSRTFLKKYGHTPSIMDYSRFNYAVQPEDGIEPELQYPRIKEYDKWAIEYGYRLFPEFKSAKDEQAMLNKWVIEHQKNPRLWFGHEMNMNDPRSQTEDLGDNQMKANALGIKNLKRVMAALPEWTKVDNEDYKSLYDMYREVTGQFNRYVGHVSKWVGGIYENPKKVEQDGVVYTFVGKDKQQEAMRWLDDQVFKTPSWLISRDVFDKTGLNELQVFAELYGRTFANLLSSRVVVNMIAAERALGAKAYTVNNYFTDLNSAVWSELSSGATPDGARRQLQNMYLKQLISLLPAEGMYTATTDVPAVVIGQLNSLKSKLKAAYSSDATVRGHYQYLASEIEKALNPNRK